LPLAWSLSGNSLSLEEMGWGEGENPGIYPSLFTSPPMGRGTRDFQTGTNLIQMRISMFPD